MLVCKLILHTYHYDYQVFVIAEHKSHIDVAFASRKNSPSYLLPYNACPAIIDIVQAILLCI